MTKLVLVDGWWCRRVSLFQVYRLFRKPDLKVWSPQLDMFKTYERITQEEPPKQLQA